MRRLVFRPLVLVLTFLLGLFVTFLLTFAADWTARLLYEPSETIPVICRGFGNSEPALCSRPNLQESEEAAVYSTLIEQSAPYYHAVGTPLVVIQDQTIRGDHILAGSDEYESLDTIFAALKRDSPLAQRATLDSFREANDHSYPMLKHPFLARIRSKLISRQEVEEASRHYGRWWETFHRKYPDAAGFFMLSKVGFNPEMNQAIVYRAFACGDTCGHGSYLFLIKEGEVWTIKAQAGQWVS